MYNRVSTLLILLAPFTIFSQKIKETPVLDPPVRQVIEWTTKPDNEGTPARTQKGSVYDFRRDGRLEYWQANDNRQREKKFTYDDRNRLLKVVEKDQDGRSETTFSYRHARTIIKTTGDIFSQRIIYFLNNNDLPAEEKIYTKSDQTGNSMKLTHRQFFNYDDRDSLLTIMEYVYRDGQMKEQQKTIHTYGPEGRKIKTVDFDENGNPVKQTDFTYDGDGRLTLTTISYLVSGQTELTQYVWKDGHLAQKIQTTGHRKTVDIYKDGKLTRTRVLEGEIVVLFTDYQYLRWEKPDE